MSEESEALVLWFFSPKIRSPALLVFAGLDFGRDVSAFGGTEGVEVDFCLGMIFLFSPLNFISAMCEYESYVRLPNTPRLFQARRIVFQEC